VPICAFLLFVVSAVAHGEECALFGVFRLFFAFFANFAKKLFPNFYRHDLRTSATFVPNLTFLDLVSPEISLGEKPATHPDTHPTN